jgi:hypothetical protein
MIFTAIDATQKETAIDQRQHGCETRDISTSSNHTKVFASPAIASKWWRVRELYCLSTYILHSVVYIN